MNNIEILGDEFDSLSNEIYINNNSPVPPAKKVDLKKEGENTIIIKWNSKLASSQKMFDNYTYLLLLDLSHFDSSEIYINQFMFNDCLNVKFIDLTNFNPSAMASLWFFFGIVMI